MCAAAWLVIAGCAGEPPENQSVHASPESKRVLVVYNAASAHGEEIARYYVRRRGIPKANVVRLNCTEGEEAPRKEIRRAIQDPIEARIRKGPYPIDFVVLIKGIPIRFAEAPHYSVDAWIAASDLPITPLAEVSESALEECLNPYYGAREAFSSRKFGFYLVTRIDGYSLADCMALIDRSVTARGERGPFLFDMAGNRRKDAYGVIQEGLSRAARLLQAKGMATQLESTDSFLAPAAPLAGYASWGSNDAEFTEAAYRRLRFKPGALCETFVSTSGRTFKPTRGGQSLVADLIAGGATGVKGYVSEPFTFALAKPDILFDRYTSGRNLAESFYSASQVLKWKDVVVGDPLCAPYRK